MNPIDQAIERAKGEITPTQRQLAKVAYPAGMYYAELLPEDVTFLEARGAIVEYLP